MTCSACGGPAIYCACAGGPQPPAASAPLPGRTFEVTDTSIPGLQITGPEGGDLFGLSDDQYKEMLRSTIDERIYQGKDVMYPRLGDTDVSAVDSIWKAVEGGYFERNVKMLFFYLLAKLSYRDKNEHELRRSLNTMSKRNATLRAKLEEQRKQLRRLHESRRIDGAQYNDLHQRHQSAKEEIATLKRRLSRYEPKGM